MDLTAFDALTFDCYGTLIDWESGIERAIRPFLDSASVEPSREELLAAFGEAEPRLDAAMSGAPYPEILAAVHKDLAAKFGAKPDEAAAVAFGASVGDWPPFPDTTDALAELRRHYKLVVVSNVDRASFGRTQGRIGVPFDAVITAQDAGAYKPDHRMFERAFEVLRDMGVPRDRILHVAESLYHDHVPAKALGLKTVHVDRRRGQPGGATRAPTEPVTPDLVVPTLGHLADLVTAQMLAAAVTPAEEPSEDTDGGR